MQELAHQIVSEHSSYILSSGVYCILIFYICLFRYFILANDDDFQSLNQKM